MYELKIKLLFFNFRWMYAWRICEYTKIHEQWNKFAIAAVKNGEVELGCTTGNYFLHFKLKIFKSS